MKLEFKLEKEDFIKFKVNNNASSRRFKRGKATYFLLVICIFLMLYLANCEIQYIMAVIIPLFIMGIFFTPIGKIQCKRMLKREYEKEQFSYLFDKIIIELKENNIRYEDLNERKEIPFTSVLGVNLIDNYLTIVLKSKKYLVIPIRSFKCEADKRNFINFLEIKVGKKVINSYPETIL